MVHISGSDRSQLLLLPEAIDDYVVAGNPARFIDAFVDGLDLKAAGFERVEAKATGRPGYAPGDLLKLSHQDRFLGSDRAVPVHQAARARCFSLATERGARGDSFIDQAAHGFVALLFSGDRAEI